MTRKLTLYSRRDCCLCDDMKAVIGKVAAQIPCELEEIDVDRSPELQEQYGEQVPVLLIDGRKVFKFRVTVEQLTRHLTERRWRGFNGLRFGARRT
ncbi:MAG: glutaredoxin family protein [Candidatus Binatia bacterium]